MHLAIWVCWIFIEKWSQDCQIDKLWTFKLAFRNLLRLCICPSRLSQSFPWFLRSFLRSRRKKGWFNQGQEKILPASKIIPRLLVEEGASALVAVDEIWSQWVFWWKKCVSCHDYLLRWSVMDGSSENTLWS
jgi:hypothetical protein